MELYVRDFFMEGLWVKDVFMRSQIAPGPEGVRPP